VLQFWLHSSADPIHYKDYAAFLGTVAGHSTIFLHQRQSAQHRSLASSLQMQSRFHQDLFSCHETKDVLEVSANYMADIANAELGFACRRKGRSWKLVAASNADRVIAASAQALLLAAAVDSLPRDKLVIMDGADKDTPEQVRLALDQCGASLLIGSFASEKDGVAPRIFLGALRQNHTAPTQEITNSVSAAAYAAARLFHEKEIREALPFSGIFHAAARTRLLWHEHPRRFLLTGAGLVAALLLILFLPWSWKITADCTVMPAHRLSAVAGTDGKLLDVMVGEGDLVSAGQVLARIDDRDIRSELAAAEQERQRWRVEAASAQAVGNDADRKIAELNELREEESMKLLAYRLARTQITSPMSGVIITRELRNQEGQNMETGKVLCEVADPTAYLLELQIRQQDLGEVQTALSDDQPHRIDFILHSHSDRKLHAEVQGLASLAPAAELGPKGSYFILRTQFPGGEISIPDLKTGYTGKAKITLGTRPLWRVLFTPFLNYISMEWGV
jgi:multidrug resistance efflux pump